MAAAIPELQPVVDSPAKRMYWQATNERWFVSEAEYGTLYAPTTSTEAIVHDDGRICSMRLHNEDYGFVRKALPNCSVFIRAARKVS